MDGVPPEWGPWLEINQDSMSPGNFGELSGEGGLSVPVMPQKNHTVSLEVAFDYSMDSKMEV